MIYLFKYLNAFLKKIRKADIKWITNFDSDFYALYSLAILSTHLLTCIRRVFYQI
jgi:hypothetical protein